MKKLYHFLILAFFSSEVFAQNFVSPIILKNFTGEKSQEIFEQNSLNFKPNLTNNLVYDVRFNDEYQGTNPQDEFSNASSKGRLYSSLNFTKNFALNSFLKIEPSNKLAQNNNGKNRAFQNESLFFEELNFTYNSKKFAAILGKFDLNFGSAWIFNRGIWASELAQNYQQKEKLGVGGVYRAGNSKTIGGYNFSLTSFTNDRKNLDNSIITSRESDSKSSNKAGDTRNLGQSYNAAVDINFDFSEQEKLAYHFSYLNLAVNKRGSLLDLSKISNQKSWAAGMNYKYLVAQNFALDALLEYVSSKNVGGNSDAKENYFTGNVIGKIYQNWNVTLAYAKRDFSQIAATGFEQDLAEISAGYEFKKNICFDKLLIQAGYKNQRDDYKTNLQTRNVLGILLRYQKSF
jgi:hypothetical protein